MAGAESATGGRGLAETLSRDSSEANNLLTELDSKCAVYVHTSSRELALETSQLQLYNGDAKLKKWWKIKRAYRIAPSSSSPPPSSSSSSSSSSLYPRVMPWFPRLHVASRVGAGGDVSCRGSIVAFSPVLTCRRCQIGSKNNLLIGLLLTFTISDWIFNCWEKSSKNYDENYPLLPKGICKYRRIFQPTWMIFLSDFSLLTDF